MKTLIEDMEYWRSERPDEWKMDEFIRGVQQLQTKLTESEARVARLYDALSAANENSAEKVLSSVTWYQMKQKPAVFVQDIADKINQIRQQQTNGGGEK